MVFFQKYMFSLLCFFFTMHNSLSTHSHALSLTLSPFPLRHTSLYKELRGCLAKQRNTGHIFQLCLFLNFSAEVTHIQDLELCNCIFLKTCKWTLQSADIKRTQQLQSADIKRTSQIRLTLNNKIECTSSEQIKLHQGIKSISKNSACDEGIQTVFQCLVIALCNSGVSHRTTKQVLTVHKQCLVIALCNSGYHIYPPNKC